LLSLLVGGAYLASVYPATSQEAQNYQARADVLKGNLQKVIERTDKELANPDSKPTVRELPSEALAKLYLGESPAAAEELIRRMYRSQNMIAGSPGYGMVLWQEGHPEIKDSNSLDFSMLSFGAMLMAFGDKLSPNFKAEAAPHVKAGIFALRHRSEVKVEYTNIYVMQIAALLLLGEASGDQSAIADARAGLDNWINFTRKNGITEYDSSTYTAVQLGILQTAYNLTKQADLKPKLKACMDYIWSDLAANYFASSQTLSGPQSRCYSPLSVDFSIGNYYYLEGLGSKAFFSSRDWLSDDARIWTNAVAPDAYRPAPAILDLAKLPERIVEQRFGLEAGRTRYNYITPDFAAGSASAYTGNQDRKVSIEFKTAKKLPIISFVVDPFDAPYGQIKVLDGAHYKSRKLKEIIASVQDKGAILAVMDVSPEVGGQEFENIATNIFFPVKADAVYIDGKKVAADKPFSQELTKDSVLVVCEGKAAVAMRIFEADGVQGQAAHFMAKYDGNKWNAGRLVAYHYVGAKTKMPEGPIRAGLFFQARQCDGQEALNLFLKESLELKIQQKKEGAQWSASVNSGGTKLDAALDLKERKIAWRRVNEQDILPKRLSVNGRDIAAEILDARLAISGTDSR